MTPPWFVPRRYKHFDVPVKPAFCERVLRPGFVARHSFAPLVFYDKLEHRYRAHIHKVEAKPRPIMYASHRDACILSYYSWHLGQLLEIEYERLGIGQNVIAYRALHKANYYFSADALQYAREHTPCRILAFDVRGFFSGLDHKLLKRRLKAILGVRELPADWYAVFRHVSRYSSISRDNLRLHPVFGYRLKEPSERIIGTIQEIRAAGFVPKLNSNPWGIPQGTPISSTLANLYMIDFDAAVSAHCRELGAFYRRYSDDLIFICCDGNAAGLEAFVDDAIKQEKLEFNAAKTERTVFDPFSTEGAQYLGFQLSHKGATIRPSSLARQWRKLKYAVRRAKRDAEKAIAAGRASKVYTRKLRKRFSSMPVSVRNFSSYARRSAVAFESTHILRQVRRIERKLEVLISGF